MHIVQTAGLFKDSKTFVDMSLIGTAEVTLKNFEQLMLQTSRKPSKEDLMEFIQQNFQTTSNELENWYPPDYHVAPPFLRKIKPLPVRNLAKLLLDTWPNLGRKVRNEVIYNSYKYSILPVPNGFIIPGGRFREFYYWDSYWIIRGLLVCNMKHTAKGMLENFFKIIATYGFVPNGGRVYYLDRSQPPLLTLMVSDYVELTNEMYWLKKSIKFLEMELNYWLNYKIVVFNKDGRTYRLAHYLSSSDLPRPESYIEDVMIASFYDNENDRKQCYQNIRTGAETGWDFSARWFFDKTGGNRGGLPNINPIRVLPVDLNAFLCKSFKVMANFFSKFGNKEKSKYWKELAMEWQQNIDAILYNEQDGIWYDFDVELMKHRKYFYPSNFAPLWTESYNTKEGKLFGNNATKYLKKNGIMDYEGGIPASLLETGQQWDHPNAWAPLQAMVIFGLERTGDPESVEVAREFAKRWIKSLIKVSQDTHEIFEKYNAMFMGMYGGGGEYEVQTGFGWTNGVLLELIEYYYVHDKGLDLGL